MGQKNIRIKLMLMICPVCLNKEFLQYDVLKERLINEWQLSPFEVKYINKQQGLTCTSCGCNLRSMTLAASIMRQYKYEGAFNNFYRSRIGRKHNLLELNEVFGLHVILKKFKKYTFAEYPDVDIQNLPYDNSSYDIIIHSDTLEHIQNSTPGLQECYRVLKKGGKMFFTVPIIYGRLSKKRHGLPSSYHGIQDEKEGEDYKVWTEYGSDFWVELFNSGFKEVTINTIDDLSSLSICSTKQ